MLTGAQADRCHTLAGEIERNLHEAYRQNTVGARTDYLIRGANLAMEAMDVCDDQGDKAILIQTLSTLYGVLSKLKDKPRNKYVKVLRYD